LPGCQGPVALLANRVSSLTRRLGLIEEIAMTGGVAKNRGVQDASRKAGLTIKGSTA